MERTGYDTLNKIPIALVAIQGTCIFLFISSFNLNTILPWAGNTHLLFTRTFLILLSFFACFLEKIVSRKRQDWPLRLSTALIFVSHLTFSYAFVCSRPYLATFDGVPLLRKARIHTNLIFSLINSAIFGSYLSLLSHHISRVPMFTEVPGLFVYLKRQFSDIFNDSKKMFTVSLRMGLTIACLYFSTVHVIIKTLARALRIDIIYTTFVDLAIHVLVMSVSNFVYLSASSAIDHLIIFNMSFASAETTPDILSHNVSEMSVGERHYWFHRVFLSYKELKVKNRIKLVKDIQECVEYELSDLARLVDVMKNSKMELDSSLYVTVPQPNKNFIKRYRAYHVFEMIKKKMAHEAWMVVLCRKYRTLSGVAWHMLNFVSDLKKKENLCVVSPAVLHLTKDLLKAVRGAEKMCGISLEGEVLAEFFTKLSQ